MTRGSESACVPRKTETRHKTPFSHAKETPTWMMSTRGPGSSSSSSARSAPSPVRKANKFSSVMSQSAAQALVGERGGTGRGLSQAPASAASSLHRPDAGEGKPTGAVHYGTQGARTPHSSSVSAKTPAAASTRWSALSQTAGHRRGDLDDRSSHATDWANYVELDSTAKRLVIMVSLFFSFLGCYG